MVSEPHVGPSNESVLSKAALNAAKHLELSHAELAQLLGASEESVSELVASERFLDPDDAEGERALMLVQIFRMLDVLVGGDADACVTWMNAHNKAIGDLPRHAVQTLPGLRLTLAYLKNLVAGTLGEKANRLR